MTIQLDRAVLSLEIDKGPQFFAELDKAERKALGLGSAFEKTQRSQKSLTSSTQALGQALDDMFGARLEQRAQAISTGFLQLGSASKLTSAEIKQNLGALDAWITKAGKLGKEVPAHILSTRDALAKANVEGQKTPGIFDSISAKSVALGAAIGSFLGNLAWSAVNKLGSELMDFVAKGAKLPAVETSFRRLSTGIRQDSDAMLASMTKGTKGMVSNFDLMQTANKAMLLKLPVTAQSMGEIVEIASKLGRAMGKEATPSVNEFVEAIGKGSPEILNNFGIIVKAEDAYRTYALRIDKSVDSLTAAEKQTAVYDAAMEAARKKTTELGDQTMTLGDIADSVWTSLGNHVTKAASIINTQVGKILTNKDDLITFLKLLAVSGSPGKALAVMQAGDDAKASAGQAGPNINLTSELPAEEELKRILDAAKKTAEEGLKPLTAAQRQAAVAMNDGRKSAKDIADELNKYKVTSGVTEAQIQHLIERQRDAKKAGDDYARVLKDIAAAQIPLTEAQKTEVRQLLDLGIGHNDIAKKLKVSEIAVKNYADQQKTLNDIVKQQIALLPRLKKEFETIDLGGFNSNVLRGFNLPGGLPNLPMEQRSSLIDPIPLDLTDEDVARAAIGWAKKTGNEIGETMATSWRARFSETMSNVFKDSALNLAGGIGDALAEGISTGDWSNFKDSLQNALANFMGSAIAGAVDFIVPGLGTALQPLFQALSDKFLGLFRDRQHEQVNDLRDEFLAQFGGSGTGAGSGFGELARQLHELGAAGDAMFQRLINARRVEDFQRAMEDVQEALANSPAAMAAAAGYHTREELQETADKARQVYEYMRDSGKYSAEQVAAAWEKAKDAQIAAMDDAQRAAFNANQKTVDGLKKQLEDLNAEYDQLNAAVSSEAHEEVMGDVEKVQRARMDAIKEEREAVQKQLEEANKALELSMTNVAEAMKELASVLRNDVGGAIDDLDGKKIRIDVEYNAGDVPSPSTPPVSHASNGGLVTPWGVMSAQYFALGGAVKSIFKPKGPDTVPVMAKPGEIILEEGRQGVIAAGMAAASRVMDQIRALATATRATASPGLVESGGGAPSISVSVDARGATFDSAARVDELADKIESKILQNIDHGRTRTKWVRQVRRMALEHA